MILTCKEHNTYYSINLNTTEPSYNYHHARGQNETYYGPKMLEKIKKVVGKSDSINSKQIFSDSWENSIIEQKYSNKVNDDDDDDYTSIPSSWEDWLENSPSSLPIYNDDDLTDMTDISSINST